MLDGILAHSESHLNSVAGHLSLVDFGDTNLVGQESCQSTAIGNRLKPIARPGYGSVGDAGPGVC